MERSRMKLETYSSVSKHRKTNRKIPKKVMVLFKQTAIFIRQSEGSGIPYPNEARVVIQSGVHRNDGLIFFSRTILSLLTQWKREA